MCLRIMGRRKNDKMDKITITKILDLNEINIKALVTKSLDEGFTFIDRLEEEYQNGKNRFDQPGEILFGAFNGTKLIAIGGLNIDPYADNTTTGRVRHLYVHPKWRKQGIGKALVEKIIEAAKGHFPLLRLRTFNEEAALFYLAIGFQATSDSKSATHFILLE